MALVMLGAHEDHCLFIWESAVRKIPHLDVLGAQDQERLFSWQRCNPKESTSVYRLWMPHSSGTPGMPFAAFLAVSGRVFGPRYHVEFPFVWSVWNLGPWGLALLSSPWFPSSSRGPSAFGRSLF